MTRFAASLCLLILLIYSGCEPKTKPRPDLAQQDTKIQSTHLQVQPQTLGQLPTNSGLQLPVVSPDGKWIAYLDFQGDAPPELRSLFTGQNLQAMSAHFQPVAPNAQPRTLCRSGAAWPTWSADSKKLLFVAYTDSSRCDLLIHNPQTATTRRLTIPFKSVSMPALSPSGQRAAVVVFDPQSQSARLHVVNLATGNIEHTCPADSQTDQQLWPQWTPDGQIIFVLNHDGQSHLIQWRPGESPPQKIAQIDISSSPSAMYQAFEALGRPLSPDARRFAYYDTAQDRIILLSLADGKRTQLPVGTRAGCWLDSQQFVAAGPKRMRLFSVPPTSTISTLTMRGQWLPRGADPATSQLILCTRAADPRNFALVRMKILSLE